MGPRMKIAGILVAVSVLLLPAALSAQPRPQPDLKFPGEVRELPSVVPIEMAIYKPAGPGPFPALIVYPSANGLDGDTISWAIAAVQKGYVTLVVDYLRPRNLSPKDVGAGLVQYTQGAKDALQALAHLRAFSIVDRQRIGIMGFSWGGMAALLAGSAGYRGSIFPGASGFAAAVSFYPGCYYPPSKSGGERNLLRPDHDTRTLILMGAKDNEATPLECDTRVAALKAKGRAVDMHMYADAGHAWDAKSRDGFRKTDSYGNQIVYRYSRETHEDSSRRAFDFLNARLRPGL